MTDRLTPEHGAAEFFARQAGELLLALRNEGGVEDLGSVGDRRSHKFLIAALGSRFPDDQIRSEEEERPVAPGDPKGRLWIVDPLDGTREYGEGRDDWAVHVALSIDGSPVVGSVALPAQDVVLSTAHPLGLSPAEAVPRLLVSRSRPPAFIPDLVARLGATTVPMGSAGAKIAAVIRGRAEIYVHAGGQYEWDSAAPVAVALASGLHASRIDGSPLRYARSDPWLPDLLVCHPSLASAALEALAELVSP